MTLIEQVKILDDFIKANKAQYDLDREAAKISGLLSSELEKYKHLTGKDLKYKPDVIQKAKFEYSPLGKIFNEGLDEKEKTKGLLKRLKNIEGKNEQQLEAIKDQGERQLEAIKNYSTKKKSFKELEFSSEMNKKNEVFAELDQLREEIKRGNLLCVYTNGTEYNFSNFKLLEQFYYDIVSGRITIEQAKDEQNRMNELI